MADKKLMGTLISTLQEAREFGDKLNALNKEADTYKHDEIDEVLDKAAIAKDMRQKLKTIFKHMLSSAFRDGILRGHALNKKKDG